MIAVRLLRRRQLAIGEFMLQSPSSVHELASLPVLHAAPSSDCLFFGEPQLGLIARPTSAAAVVLPVFGEAGLLEDFLRDGHDPLAQADPVVDELHETAA